jgi:hypothetical protein
MLESLGASRTLEVEDKLQRKRPLEESFTEGSRFGVREEELKSGGEVLWVEGERGKM